MAAGIDTITNGVARSREVDPCFSRSDLGSDLRAFSARFFHVMPTAGSSGLSDPLLSGAGSAAPVQGFRRRIAVALLLCSAMLGTLCVYRPRWTPGSSVAAIEQPELSELGRWAT